MGDGRYYTYYQFFNIVLVTFLTIFVVASLAYSYYRLSNQKNRFFTNMVFLLIVIFAVLHTIEAIIPNIEIARILRNTKSLVIIALMSYYAIQAIMTCRLLSLKNKIESSSQLQKLFISGFTVMSFILIMSGAFTEAYKFHQVTYSLLYKAIVLMLLITYIFFIVKIVRFKSHSCGIGPNKSNSDLILMLLKLFFLSPYLIYIMMLFKNSHHIDFMEILIIFACSLLLNLDLYTNDEAGITMHAFDKMGDMSLDSIFVTDMSGRILYKNKSSKNSNFFKQTDIMENNQIQSLFSDEIVIKSNHMGREYLVLKHDDEKHYFAFKSVVLKEHFKSIGYIITITEITELINLLHALEEKQEVSKSVNQKLKKHALVVYRLEKEKEINSLLEEIITSRETQMNILSQLIKRTKNNMDLPSFESDIEESIEKSNAILEDVRKTVSNYRAYYGEDLLNESKTGRHK